MKNGVDILGADLRDAQAWLDAVALRLNVKSRIVALQSLKATLQALRGQLGPEAIIELGGQLPPVVRALWYEGWRPAERVRPATRRETFLNRVEGAFPRAPRLKAERAAKAALGVIFQRLPAATMAPVVETLPADLATLWPDEPPPYTDLRQVRPEPPAIDEARRSRVSPQRLRHATRRAPGDIVANALPERHRSRRL